MLRARRTLVQAGWWRWAQQKAAKATFVALHSAESPKSYSRRSCCWQNGIGNTRAVAVVCDTHCRRAELGVRHADSQREATAVIAKPASVLLYDTAVWYLVCVWACGCVFCDGMSDAMGSKSRCKLFRLSFSTGRSSRKSQLYRLDAPVGEFSRKKLSPKSPLLTV